MNCIIGYSGFVGNNLLRFYHCDYLINSKNLENIKYKKFNNIFFCGLPSTKYLINQNPEIDNNNLKSIKNVLKTIKCNKFILISTIDIYTSNQVNENFEPDYINNHTYGRNRYLFEGFVAKYFHNYHIIRLPALFGKGLKKNIIYDLLNNNQVENISLKTRFQWYNLEWLKNDIDIAINNDIKICNLFTEPIDTIEIINLFNYPQDKFINNNNTEYDVYTKYSNLFRSDITNYIRNKNILMNDIKIFINNYNIQINHLCISNICLNRLSHQQFSEILKLHGFQYVEIAPSKHIEWDHLDVLNLDVYTKNNIKPYSFQALLYKLNNLNIFKNTSDIIQHIKKVIDIACQNNIKILVFGSPINRYINDHTINYEQIATNFFYNIGTYCEDKNITLCIEPNSKKYNCNYLTNIRETEQIIRKINHPNIKMMIDLGNAILENDDLSYINNIVDIIYHIHISQQYMADFTNPHRDNHELKNILRNIQYDKKITLEMLNKSDDELSVLNNSILNFIDIYNKI